LIGFGDIFSGIKNLYDLAGTKLRNFVNGPVKAAPTENKVIINLSPITQTEQALGDKNNNVIVKNPQNHIAP
jgi:hypothetical protein